MIMRLFVILSAVLLPLIGVARADQVTDAGVTDLAARVPDDVLAGISLTLKQAFAAGKEMPAPDDLMPAQEALQWISDRTYVVEPTVAWPSPELVEQRAWSDCKGKSIWLADRLLRLGYRDVRIKIGKIPDLSSGHAWVEMTFGGIDYILDGTYRGKYTIIPKDRVTIHSDHKILYTVSPEGYVSG